VRPKQLVPSWKIRSAAGEISVETTTASATSHDVVGTAMIMTIAAPAVAETATRASDQEMGEIMTGVEARLIVETTTILTLTTETRSTPSCGPTQETMADTNPTQIEMAAESTESGHVRTDSVIRGTTNSRAADLHRHIQLVDRRLAETTSHQ
jgi:hypothetical protein